MPRILIIFLLLNITGCSSTKRNLQQAGANRPAAPVKATTLTLVLKASWNADSSVHFSIYNDIRNEGLQPPKRTARKSSSFLLCFTGQAAGTADSVYIDHPLKEWAETITAQGTIAKELFIREEAYTEVSIPYTPDRKKLLVTNLQTQKQQTLDIR